MSVFNKKEQAHPPKTVAAEKYEQEVNSLQDFITKLNTRLQKMVMSMRFPGGGFHPARFFKENAGLMAKLIPVAATDMVLTFLSIQYALDNALFAVIMVIGLGTLMVILPHLAASMLRSYQLKGASSGKLFTVVALLVAELVLITSVLIFRIMHDATTAIAANESGSGGLAGAGGADGDEGAVWLTLLFFASMLGSAVLAFVFSYRDSNILRDDYKNALQAEIELSDIARHIDAVSKALEQHPDDKLSAANANNLHAAQQHCYGEATSLCKVARRAIAACLVDPVFTQILSDDTSYEQVLQAVSKEFGANSSKT